MIPKELAQKVRYIQIYTNKTVNDVMAGEYHSVFKGQGVEFVHPQPGIPEQAVVQDVVLVGMARDEDIHMPLTIESEQALPVTRRIDDDPSLIIHDQGMAVRVFPAPDEPDPASGKIEHGMLRVEVVAFQLYGISRIRATSLCLSPQKW